MEVCFNLLFNTFMVALITVAVQWGFKWVTQKIEKRKKTSVSVACQPIEKATDDSKQ